VNEVKHDGHRIHRLSRAPPVVRLKSRAAHALPPRLPLDLRTTAERRLNISVLKRPPGKSLGLSINTRAFISAWPPRHCCRTFERNYQLAEHVEVKGAWPETGLLHVDFVRETFWRR
jgi:hypothetical protein